MQMFNKPREAEVFDGNQMVRRRSRRKGSVQENRCWYHMEVSRDPHVTPTHFCPNRRIHLDAITLWRLVQSS